MNKPWPNLIYAHYWLEDEKTYKLFQSIIKDNDRKRKKRLPDICKYNYNRSRQRKFKPGFKNNRDIFIIHTQ